MISIIIPVYNVKKYLKDCLDGILMQTYTDWECILVDDGSKDGSAEICDSYALRDARFKVIHKENGGVSSARNMGLKEARGEWVAFVDADDMISPRYLTSLIESAEEGDDLIVGGNTYFGNESGETVPPENQVVTREHFKDYIFTDTEWTWQRIFYVVWGKLFRLAIIQDNKLLFDTNMIRSEDTTFMLLYLTKIKNVRLLAVKHYAYRYEFSNKAYYGFTVEKFIAQQKAYTKYMDVVCNSDIGSFKRIICHSQKSCFALFLSSLKTKRDFVSGIEVYKKYDNEFPFLYDDFKHRLFFLILFYNPSLGYVIYRLFKLK